MNKYYILLLAVLLTGCSNDMDTEIMESPLPPVADTELIPIQAEVAGIEDFYGGSVTRSGERVVHYCQPLDSAVYTGYDIETTVESVSPDPLIQTRGALANIRFRILAYKGTVSTANYVGQGDYTTNGSGVASAVSGQALLLPQGTYTFVCYSFGTNAALAAFNGSSATTLSVSNGSDFMTYTKSGVVVSGASYTVSGISFVRQCARLELEVNTAGFENKIISACSASVSNLSVSGSWTMGSTDTGNLSVSGSTGSSSFTSWSRLNSASITGQNIVLPVANRALEIKLSATIGGTAYTNKTVSLASTTFTKGGDYKVTIKIKLDGIIVAGIVWAKSNLYNDSSDRNYKIGSSQEYVHKSGDTEGGSYFGWNTLDWTAKTFNDGAYDPAKDPCSKLPGGKWRTPSKEQFDALVALSNKSWDSAKNGYWFDGKLFLPAAGNRFTDGSMVNVGSFGFYWSSTPDGSGGYYLGFLRGNIAVSNYHNRSNGFPVRCVQGS